MKKRKLLFTLLALSLGCFFGGGEAMAQSTNNGWNALTTQEQTLSDDWTPLSTDQTTGYTLGASGTTKHYYITKNLNFTNSNAGGSGLKIQGTVYLYIPNGLSITCIGANANGLTGAGAGIELASGNTLYIIGGAGTVTAIGGNAANGKDGNRGDNASFSYDSWIKTGAGGKGGDGGGGAGAGIGSRGGAGGVGGAGGAAQQPNYPSYTNGTNGTDGSNGNTAGSMGNLYVANGITVNATGGATGTSGGAGGRRGTCAVEDSASKNYSMAGGGGGGGGGFGGAASNVGTGGPGGGGGGGGAGGTQERCSSGYLAVYAPGGKAGKNADGSNAQDGEDAYIYGDWQQGSLISNSNWSEGDWSGSTDATKGSPGNGGGQGSASSGGTQNTGNLTYNITYHYILPSVRTETVKYNPSTGASVILPQNSQDGYQWALGVYGKDCHVVGEACEFTTASKEFYGNSSSATAGRTIYLKDVYGNLDFYEVKSVCMLKNKGSNAQEIGDFFVADNNPNANAPKWPITVRLQDRTLYKDGKWNSICLPFSMTKDQVAASPLAGATIKKLNTSVSGYYPSGKVNKAPYQEFYYGYPVVLIWFDDVDLNSENLVAGQPYLVMWSSGSNLVDDTTEAGEGGETPTHQLDFNYVTVKETEAKSWVGAGTTNGNVTFAGTFSSTELLGGDKTKLILGVEVIDNILKNTLYYPSKTLSVAACRAYFIIPDAAVTTNARQFVMGLDDSEATSIQTLNVTPEKQNESTIIYNLNGQRLSAPQKGINIVNGKKILVK